MDSYKDTTRASPIRLGLLTGPFPTITMSSLAGASSMPSLSDPEPLEYLSVLSHRIPNLRTSCYGPCLVLLWTGPALSQGRNYQQTTSPRHWVLISVACS